MAAIDTLAHFAVTGTAGARVPRLALHLADAALAHEAGAATQEGQALARFLRASDEGLLGRVATSAALVRLTEIDDIHRPSCVTVAALTAPVALAFAGDHPAALFDALFVGQELALRLAMAAGGARLLARGQWPSLVAAPLGAAAVAGRLMGLSEDRMRHALAIALTQVPRAAGRPQGQRPARWLQFGQAVRAGCLAALAAADGISGDPNLLDEPWLRSIGGELAAPAWLDADGLAPVSAAPCLVDGLSIKHHASAKQALAAVHGLRELMAREGIAPDDIESIEVRVPPAYAPMLDREPPQTSRLASLVSAPWQLALAAWRPQLLDDVARDRFPDDPRLAALAARVRVQADAGLDALYPAAYPAALALRAAGTVHEVLVTDSPGDPALPYDPPRLLDKARRMLGARGEDDPRLAPLHAALRLPADPRALAPLRAAFGYA